MIAEGALTTFLAVWGAIVATIALTWNMLRHRGDRGILKVTGMIGKMYPDHTDRTYLFITITNVGRRPVLVQGIYGMRDKSVGPKRGVFIKAERLPVMLKEGEFFCHPCHGLDMLDEHLETIYAQDSTGRKWPMKRRNLRQVIRDYQEDE